MPTHTMRTRTAAHSVLPKKMRKYAGMRSYLNFFQKFIIIIFPAYQGTCFTDNFFKKVRPEIRLETRLEIMIITYAIWLLNPLKVIVEVQFLHLTLVDLHSLHIDFLLSKHVICFITLQLLQPFFISNSILVLVNLEVRLELEVEVGLELELRLELEVRLEFEVRLELELNLELEVKLESELE